MTVESKIVYTSPWLQVREDKVSNDSGTRTYMVVERDNSVIVIPLSPRQKTVLLRQYRHPIRDTSWEFPMGGIDGNETPEDAARRELLEETGLSSQSLKLIGQYRAVPGLTPQQVFVFVALVEEGEFAKAQNPVYTDDIESSKIVSFDEVQMMAARGEIVDGFTLVGLLFAKIYFEQRM